MELEAQLTALGHDKAKWHDLLLCVCEGKAFQKVTNEIVKSGGKIAYGELKTNLTKTFCGPDYLRTLQSKLRCLVFKKGMKINTYITEVRRVISELYDITEEHAINQLTVNHIMSNLDSEMREQAHLLQLTGSPTPEGLLELIESKMRCHPFATETASVNTANAETDHLGCLEKSLSPLQVKLAECLYQKLFNNKVDKDRFVKIVRN